MKVTDSVHLHGATLLFLSGERPETDWRRFAIGGADYEPLAVMDAGRNVTAVSGEHDLTGRDIEFV